MKYGHNLLREDFLICQWMSIIESSKMYNWNVNDNYQNHLAPLEIWTNRVLQEWTTESKAGHK